MNNTVKSRSNFQKIIHRFFHESWQFWVCSSWLQLCCLRYLDLSPASSPSMKPILLTGIKRQTAPIGLEQMIWDAIYLPEWWTVLELR